jgi:hypothetical protein
MLNNEKIFQGYKLKSGTRSPDNMQRALDDLNSKSERKYTLEEFEKITTWVAQKLVEILNNRNEVLETGFDDNYYNLSHHDEITGFYLDSTEIAMMGVFDEDLNPRLPTKRDELTRKKLTSEEQEIIRTVRGFLSTLDLSKIVNENSIKLEKAKDMKDLLTTETASNLIRITKRMEEDN